MRWSPLMPVLSGVAPFPYFSHANMLLQICMPRSFTILVFTTRLPLAAMMLAKAHPNRLLRTCPKCKGLLVLGEEYSIMTKGEWSVASVRPNCTSWWISVSRPIQLAGAITRFRKPLTALKSATTEGISVFRKWPSSWAVSSGFLRDIFKKGKTTNVRCPANSFFVFWSCTVSGAMSCPYKVLMPRTTADTILFSISITLFLPYHSGCKDT